MDNKEQERPTDKPIILIEFFDATHDPGWEKEDKDFRGCGTCSVVGFKMQEDKDCVVLAMMRSDGGRCTERMIVPKGAILVVERLKEEEHDSSNKSTG